MDVRFVVGTCRALTALVHEGKLIAGLYYRLNECRLPLPALRDRRGDIPRLCRRFLREISRERGTPPPALSAGARAWAARQEWPGDVLQLRETLRRVVALEPATSVIEPAHLKAAVEQHPPIP